MPVAKRSLPVVPADAWGTHVAKWKDCQACPLCEQRFRICLARGTVPCDVLFIGEAPGSVENDLGLPFKGPAGNLLDQIIERALGCLRIQTPTGGVPVTHALTNLVCCFPAEAKAAGTNEPRAVEILACRPRLVEFANIAQPRLVVCVGSLATKYVEQICTGPRVDMVHPAHILAHTIPAKKPGVINRCVVQIRNGWERVTGGQFKPWQWEASNAGGKKGNGRRAEYDLFNWDEATRARPLAGTNEDDIPF